MGSKPASETNYLKCKIGGFVINHINEKCGPYTIIEELNKRANDGHLLYIGQCECGQIRCDTISNFKSQTAKSCSHFQHYGTISIPNGVFQNKRISSIFHGMLRRCYIESNKDFPNYGGKGIVICKEWIDDPKSFELWSLENGYKNNLTIDRLNEDMDYCPENCRWVARESNSRFKSTTNYITATVTLSGRQWASLIPNIGINYINKLLRKYGEAMAVNFIEERLKDKRGH